MAKKRAKNDIGWRDAIVEVLGDAETPMSSRQIADEILSRGLLTTKSATPPKNVTSTIFASMNNERQETPFARVGRGEFALKSFVDSGDHGEPDTDQVLEEATGGVNAFGAYWARDQINWKSPKLLGQQQIGAKGVDLSEQKGVYLLYDAREVIYVGRAYKGSSTIISRLADHDKDRLSARWDRFSWFGLYSVQENGKLNKGLPSLDAEPLVQMLEAVLIEAMEPRQNRKRGDAFSDFEYIQVEDPKIERDKMKRMFDDFWDQRNR